MITVFLASPNTQQQADAVRDMPVLISFALWSPWLSRYQQAWGPVLIDSGAYSQLTGGVESVDLSAYRDFCEEWSHRAVACAALDDIGGDWRQSLHNLEHGPGFPTFHDSDPWELLESELIPAARERGGWLGLGLNPPRGRKGDFVRRVLEVVPDDIHVHGWALRAYGDELARRMWRGCAVSMDSTNWWRDAMDLRVLPLCRHLTYGEALEIVVKRYRRERWTRPNKGAAKQLGLFVGGEA